MHDGHWVGNLYFVGPQDSRRRWAVRQLAWLKDTRTVLAILVEALSAEEREICVVSTIYQSSTMGRTGESPTRWRETPRAGRVPSLSLSPVVASQPRSKNLEANRVSGPWCALLANFFLVRTLAACSARRSSVYVINVDVLTARLMSASCLV